MVVVGCSTVVFFSNYSTDFCFCGSSEEVLCSKLQGKKSKSTSHVMRKIQYFQVVCKPHKIGLYVAVKIELFLACNILVVCNVFRQLLDICKAERVNLS